MDTAKIRALLAAADLGSISKAADALGYTQSGVTHIIRALEEEAGFPLLLRGNRGVRLTADGERLAPLFRELAAMADRLEQELALTRGVERGAVRIGTYSFRCTGCRRYSSSSSSATRTYAWSSSRATRRR